MVHPYFLFFPCVLVSELWSLMKLIPTTLQQDLLFLAFGFCALETEAEIPAQ